MQDVYFGGDLEAGIALTGQVAGRINDIASVAQIFDELVSEFHGDRNLHENYGVSR